MDALPRLFGDVGMGAQGLLQLCGQALGTGLSTMVRAVQGGLRCLGQRCNGRPEIEETRFRLADQAQEYPALPTTLAAKLAHDLREVLMKTLGLTLERRRLCEAWWCQARDEYGKPQDTTTGFLSQPLDRGMNKLVTTT
jgi:hypothetical protein